MEPFGERHPVGFEVILLFAAFLAAAVLTAGGSLFYLQPDFSSSLARLAVGTALLVIYRRAFQGGRPFDRPERVFPALLFALWNLFYNLTSGMAFGGPAVFAEAFLTALAPAVFEEVLFRGIFLYNLRKKGYSDWKGLLISAVVFSAVHLTNLIGLDVTSVALQAAYSLVIGMVFAAVYLKNNSLLQVVAAHFLIDFTNRIYVEQASSASVLHVILFTLLLAAEAVYAVRLVTMKETAEK